MNSFFSSKFAHKREKQIVNFRKFLSKWDKKENLIFVTHYVVISELIDYSATSGEIIITDDELKLIGAIAIKY